VEAVREFLSSFELIVAVMLIVIGVVGIFLEIPIVHEHYHHHVRGALHSHLHVHRFGGLGSFARRTHLHQPLLGVGILQGLASNDELIALFIVGLGVGSLDVLLGGVAIFTLGVVLGMLLLGIVVTYPILKYGARRVQLVVNVAAGSLSILYGLLLLTSSVSFNPFDFLGV